MTKVPPEVFNFINELSMDGTMPLKEGQTIKDAEAMALERFKIRIDQAKLLIQKIKK